MSQPRGAAKSVVMPAALAGAVDLSVLKARADAAARQQSASDAAPAGAANGNPTESGAVIDVTEATFQAEVLERSLRQLVVVDLWAEWCGPCKQLSPVLERLAGESNGAWVLAKIDIDANPRIAQAFGVQSIPAVIAIAAGQPVDAFSGALPESQIRGWLKTLLDALSDKLPGVDSAGQTADSAPEVEDTRFAEAEAAMQRGDHAVAESAYQRILDVEPSNEQARLGLAQARFATRIAHIDASVLTQANVAPDDLAAQFTAADYEVAHDQVDAAFTRLITVVRRTAGDDRDRSREHLVQLFELFDPADERVAHARRSLASALF